MITPVRIQRKRTRGFNLQAESHAVNGLPCVSVTRPSRWGNPFDFRRFGRELSLALFRNTLRGFWSPGLVVDVSDEICDLCYTAHHRFLKGLGAHPLEIIGTELGGRNLGCFCPMDVSCHADIELEFANRWAA
ncbi:MAG TPA: DUF4326 domain-containing protein [Bryobacteraceae bacterium]|jgi:hypothetical protein|nr:DUF4326 domain-containing protein [Bryobacteraceae bacterium]